MKELLFNLFSSSLETIGESKLEEILQKLHDKNPGQYKVAILGGLQLVLALEPLVLTTGTKIDDAIVKALKEAINVSAKSNNADVALEQLVVPETNVA